MMPAAAGVGRISGRQGGAGRAFVRFLAVMIALRFYSAGRRGPVLFADQKIDTFWGYHAFCWPDEPVGQLSDGRDKMKCVNEWRQFSAESPR